MARYPREQLQPALLDRLNDDLASVIGELDAKRRLLEGRLDADQGKALAGMLADEALSARSLRPSELAPFLDFDEETRALVTRVLELEQARRLEVRRSYAMSMSQLRTSVLRELNHLLNTECAESLLVETDRGLVGIFDGLPYARDSVLNYGIPPLAGRIRTAADYAALARAIERAIERFEPRLSDVRVTYEGEDDGGMAVVRSPVTLIIEGELWGYPVPESLRLRTVLDLEEGQARIEGADEAEAA